MAIQTATSSALEDASRIVIEQTRFTAEHNAPMLGLVEKFTLGKGEKSVTVPKVGQMTAVTLADGVDIVASEDIGMTSTSLTATEVGLKIILTDKLVQQQNEDVFRVVGRQAGDAVARKKDTDVLGLFSALNGGTDLGAAGRDLEVGNLSVLVAFAKANKFPKPVYIVHHPWAVYRVALSLFGIAGSAGAGGAMGAGAVGMFGGSDFANDLIKDFFAFNIAGVPVFQDGNIAEDASGDGVGVVLSREALAYLESYGFRTERERDASLRATELVVTADYGVFELDDSYGAPATMNVAAEATS